MREQNAAVRYLRETRAELAKVTWPTRPEAISLTVAVLIVVTVTSAFLGGLDFLFSKLFALIIGL